MKGQTAVEYLTTYGWMIVAVSMVGGSIYTTMDFGDGCRLGTTGFSPPFPTVTETYQYDNGTLFLEITNPEEDAIKINNITIEDGNQTLGAVGIQKQVRGEGKAQITTNRFQTSEECSENTLNINYESDTLEGLATNGAIQGKINIIPLVAVFDVNTTTAQKNEEIKFNASETESENSISNYTWKFGDGETATGKLATHNYSQDGVYRAQLIVKDSTGIIDSARKTLYIGGVLTKEGGSISRIGFHNTLATDCIGPDCQNVTGTNDENILTSGDYSEGTIFTERLLMLDEKMCITDTESFGSDEGCSVYRQGPKEPLSEINYQFNGSLETPSIKPVDQALCIGENC